MNFWRHPVDHRFRIYVITNKITGLRYVGVTGGPVQRRVKSHMSNSNIDTYTPLARAIKRDGFKAFRVEWVASAVGPRNADSTERQLVAQFQTRAPLGYNMNSGGGGASVGTHKRRWNEPVRRILSMDDPEYRSAA